MEDTKFLRCEFDEGSPNRHLMAGDIHREPFDAKNGWSRRWHVVSTKDRPNMRQEFPGMGRTKDEVEAGVQLGEAFILTAGFVERLQHDDGDRRRKLIPASSFRGKDLSIQQNQCIGGRRRISLSERPVSSPPRRDNRSVSSSFSKEPVAVLIGAHQKNRLFQVGHAAEPSSRGRTMASGDC
jgi:hypothetical protein